MRSPLVTLAVLMSHLIFLGIVTFGAPCPERCSDDGPDGRCPPSCTTCLCSPRPAQTGPAMVVTAPVARAETVPAFASLVPCEPAPADIFHVPISRLA